MEDNAIGMSYTPLTTATTSGWASASGCWRPPPSIPTCNIELNALATRVLFDDSGRATGVEYLKGRLYRAAASRAG